jgi:N-acetylmuramoyl-L-alanine amidase
VIEADTPIRYELTGFRRSTFVVRFPGLAYDPLLYPLPVEHRWFQDLRPRNLSDGLEVSFTPGPRAVGFRITHSPQTRVEIFLGLDERGLREGKLRGFSTTSYLAPTPLMLVALDPGHGDGDKGARVSGGFEHALAWQLSMMVADRLTRKLGIDVVFTREEDESPDPLRRAETANRVDADFLISLHLHNRPGGPMGFVAEVGVSGRSPTSTLVTMGFRSFGAGQSSYVPTSRMIARQVLDAVAGQLQEGEQGVVAEPLPQLAAATMPAMLLELGSGGSRKWTRDRLGEVADGIVEGLRLYQMTGEDEQ